VIQRNFPAPAWLDLKTFAPQPFEQARSPAALVKVVYDRAEGSFYLASLRDSAVTPKSGRPTSATGDFDAAFAAAPIRLDETYATPDHSHAMMEPHASTAVWNGDRLTVGRGAGGIGGSRHRTSSQSDAPATTHLQ
jgi:CO/xanthine dehydrogenase Mo-binding subunit